MRLIDADKLKPTPGMFIYKSEKEDETDVISMEAYRWDLIEREAPTVKAIPIEWIKEWQNRHEWEYESFFTMREGIPKYAIECMIEDWEKEK